MDEEEAGKRDDFFFFFLQIALQKNCGKTDAVSSYKAFVFVFYRSLPTTLKFG